MSTPIASSKRLLPGVIAALLLVTPAVAQSGGSAGKTPTQPTANDPSLGLPEQPASMSKNPVAMTPDAARNEGTSPTDAGKK